jgi:hypothetical protein
MNLTSDLIEVEDTWEAVNDWFLKEKLSDGLPIVPPTVGRVERMLGATARDPEELLGRSHPNGRRAPSRKSPSMPLWRGAWRNICR